MANHIEAVIMSYVFSSQVLVELPIAFSDESDNDGSSEEEQITIFTVSRKRKWKKPQRIENYLERILPGLTERQFQQHFRISIHAYENLLNIIGPLLTKQTSVGRPAINIDKQLLSVIWILATPDSYRSIGERFDLAKSTLSICFLRVVKALNSLAPRIIQWPTGEEIEEIKRKFRTIARMNNVLGAVDGTYIPIKAPKEDPESYITRKCNYAFTLQAIASPLLKFTDIFIGYPGSVSDTRIFRNSDIYSAVRNNMLHYFPNGEYILGDKAYPVLTWCMPPYINRGQLTAAQVYFNTIHARTRQVIERAFGLLLGRFRRLKFLDMNRHNLIPATVLAACVLHNICLNFNDLLIEDYIQEGREHVVNDEEIHPNNIMLEEGRNRRNDICRQLYRDRNI